MQRAMLTERAAHKVGSPHIEKTRHQPGEQAITAGSSTNWALWCLSLVLREIAETTAPGAEKGEPPPKATDATDMAINNQREVI